LPHNPARMHILATDTPSGPSRPQASLSVSSRRCGASSAFARFPEHLLNCTSVVWRRRNSASVESGSSDVRRRFAQRVLQAGRISLRQMASVGGARALQAFQQDLEAAKRWPGQDGPAIQGPHTLELPQRRDLGPMRTNRPFRRNLFFLRAQHALCTHLVAPILGELLLASTE